MSGGPGAPSRGGQASQGLLSTFLRVRDVTGFLLPEGSCRMISTSSTLLSFSFLPFFSFPFLSPFLFISLFSFTSFLSCLSSYFSFPFFLSPFPSPPPTCIIPFSLSPFSPPFIILFPLTLIFSFSRLSSFPSPFPLSASPFLPRLPPYFPSPLSSFPHSLLIFPPLPFFR